MTTTRWRSCSARVAAGADVGNVYELLVLLLMVGAVAGAIARGVRSTDSGFGFFLAIFVAGGLGAIFSTQATVSLIARTGLEPFPQSTYLLGCFLGDAAAFFVASLLSAYTSTDKATARRNTLRRTLALGCCAVAQYVLLRSLDPKPNVEILATYGQDWRLTLFQVIFTGFIAACAIEFLVISRRYRRRPSTTWPVRISLRFEEIGGALALIWWAWLTARALLDLAGVHTFLDNLSITQLLSASIFTSMCVGAIGIQWQRPIVSILFLAWMWYFVRKVTPLHELVKSAGAPYILTRPRLHVDSPDIEDSAEDDAGEPDGAAETAGAKGDASLSWRWKRMKLEISEIQLRLKNLIHPHIGDLAQREARARTLSPQNTEALVEAAELVSALMAFKQLRDISADNTYSAFPSPGNEIGEISQHATGPPTQSRPTPAQPAAGQSTTPPHFLMPSLRQQLAHERHLIRTATFARGRLVADLYAQACQQLDWPQPDRRRPGSTEPPTATKPTSTPGRPH